MAANDLAGGFGDDWYHIGSDDTVVEHTDEGLDTVECTFSYTLPVNVENLVLRSAWASIGVGNDLSNHLDARTSSAITLYGGSGDDTYYLGRDSAAIEYAGQGVDTVFVVEDYVVPEHIEAVAVDPSAAAAVTVTGNHLGNEIRGHGAQNRLHGRGGDDVLAGAGHMSGGAGADTYVFDSYFAARVEDISEGDLSDGAVDIVSFDSTVQSTSVYFGRSVDRRDLVISRQGSSGQISIADFFDDGNTQNRIELFRFADGTTRTAEEIIASIPIIGTDSSDVLTAAAGGSDLFGLGGADVLNGASGNDLLDGGSGADTMAGGVGGDTYRIDNEADVVAEVANAGVDTVETSITYTLPTHFENLSLMGNADIDGLATPWPTCCTGMSATIPWMVERLSTFFTEAPVTTSISWMRSIPWSKRRTAVTILSVHSQALNLLQMWRTAS